MDFNINSLKLDKAYTNGYRDKYNTQCSCEQCQLFRESFEADYPCAAKFLLQFGIDIQFPIEIMDCGIDDQTLKRGYTVYYAVKGCLPKEKMVTNIDGIDAIMRSNEIADESYANTNMDKPFFIIELNNIFLCDNKAVFEDALHTGREVEFHYGADYYFLSRNQRNQWYIYCEQTKITETYNSSQKLLEKARVGGIDINTIWNDIVIDYLL
jgi:hypothetical protein